MSITQTKEVEIPANMSLMEYAQNTKGIYVNLLNLCGRSPAGKYEFRYMLSNKNLLGEKVKFQMGAEETEASVIYSCLGTDYKNQKKYRREFKEAVDQLVKDYKSQERVEAHLATENYTLAEMRKKGLI